MKKHIISGLAALAVVFSGAGALPAGVFDGFDIAASADISGISLDPGNQSGTCGEHLTWDLIKDTSGNRTLYIRGTGDMYDYTSYSAPWYNLLSNSSIKTIVVEKGVTSIGNYAFNTLYNVESITLPSGLTKIGNYAFNFCESITSIVIPDSVTSVGKSAFLFCKSLKSVTLSKNLTTLSENMFGNCTSLQSITIPDKVTAIGDFALNNCTSMKSIIIPKNVANIGIFAFGYGADSTGKDIKINDFTIKGYTGTAAETYAKDNGFKFVALDNAPDFIPGDLNDDTQINVKDLVLMQKAVAGWKVDYSLDAADFNENGTADVNDLVKLQKIVAGWKIS